MSAKMQHSLDGLMAASELIDEAATERAGEMLARSLNAGDFIGIDGELGAGKTSFVRGLARGLAIDSQLVASPTFVTMQSYEGGRLSLTHIDLWRIRTCDDLETLGWDELLATARGVIVVEWASRIRAALPAQRIDIRIDFSGEGRTIEITDQRSGC